MNNSRNISKINSSVVESTFGFDSRKSVSLNGTARYVDIETVRNVQGQLANFALAVNALRGIIKSKKHFEKSLALMSHLIGRESDELPTKAEEAFFAVMFEAGKKELYSRISTSPPPAELFHSTVMGVIIHHLSKKARPINYYRLKSVYDKSVVFESGPALKDPDLCFSEIYALRTIYRISKECKVCDIYGKGIKPRKRIKINNLFFFFQLIERYTVINYTTMILTPTERGLELCENSIDLIKVCDIVSESLHSKEVATEHCISKFDFFVGREAILEAVSKQLTAPLVSPQPKQ